MARVGGVRRPADRFACIRRSDRQGSAPTHESRKIGYLTNAYTVPEYRNRGIGGRLLKAAQEDATNEDVELMLVWPSDESLGFYRDHGFNSERDPLIWKAPGSQP